MTTEFIEAGRGYETPRETEKKAASDPSDALAAKFVKLHAEYAVLSDECQRRKNYHGGLQPIRESVI